MGVEFKGDEFLYLVEVPDEVSPFRLFNQTGGDTSVEADEIELDTKDKSGSDYGKITQTISVEGIITEGDEASTYLKKAQRSKKFVKIVEVDTRSKETEEGIYMITSFERSYANEDFAEYTLEAKLNSVITEGYLDEVPEGAPENELDEPIDDVDPDITLTGDNPMEIEIGVTYVEPGATAEDDVDGNLTDAISITGDVDTSTVGAYEVVYTVSDEAGNEVAETRDVNVVPADKSALEAKITEIEDLEESGYTEASWTTFAEALDEANGVVTNDNATKDDADEALATLIETEEGLEEQAEEEEEDDP